MRRINVSNAPAFQVHKWWQPSTNGRAALVPDGAQIRGRIDFKPSGLAWSTLAERLPPERVSNAWPGLRHR